MSDRSYREGPASLPASLCPRPDPLVALLDLVERYGAERHAAGYRRGRYGEDTLATTRRREQAELLAGIEALGRAMLATTPRVEGAADGA